MRPYLPRFSSLALRSAGALLAVFALAGSVSVSCAGDPVDPIEDARRPASAAMGQWTPTKEDSCTVAAHDDLFVLGPDGKKYPGWHEPTLDATNGTTCRFGHEHGTDPRASALWSALQEHFYFDANSNGVLDTAERTTAGLPFGYLDERLRAFDGSQRPQAHVSYKVFVANGVTRQRRAAGQLQPARDVTCNALAAFNQDTHSTDAFGNALHAVIYAIDCTGTGAGAGWRTRVIVSALARFGNPDAPGNGRNVPTIAGVQEHVWVPRGASSDYRAGLADEWTTTVRITRADATELARFDLTLRNLNPARFIEGGALARSISACHRGLDSAGQIVDNPAAASTIVRQARDGLCASMDNQTPATALSRRAAWDSRDSAFDGCEREVVLGSLAVSNGNGPTYWHTDPYGGNARTTPFTGSVRQYIGATTPINAELEPETRDASTCGGGIHAPN